MVINIKFKTLFFKLIIPNKRINQSFPNSLALNLFSDRGLEDK